MRALRRARALALLLLAGAVLAPPAAAAPPVLPPVGSTSTAGLLMTRLAAPRMTLPALGEGEVRIEVDPGGQISQQDSLIAATGGVTVTQGEIRLTAEKLTYNPDTGVVLAEGNVVFTEPGRTVRGERIVYDIDTRQVRAETAVTVVNGVIVRARTMSADPTKYTVSSASVTTCDRPRPHYQLTARTVTVIPNDRIVARRVGVWLLGVKLFVVPELTAHIGTGRGEGGQSLLPRVGSNSRDSFYIEKVLPILETPRLYLDLDGRLSVRRGLLGGFDAAAPAGRALQLIGALKYRDDAPNQRTRFLEVDRLPEVGLLWVSPSPAPRSARVRRVRPQPTPGESEAVPPAEATPAAVPAYRPLSLVGADVEHQPGLLRPPQSGRWYLRAQTTIGYFHQREASVIGGEAENLSHGRLDLRATASRSGLRVLGLRLPVLQFFVRQSYYEEGSSYNVFGAAARQEWRIGTHWSTGLQAFLHQTSGQTPFEWDRVEIRTELQPALSYTAGGTTFGWIGRMDLDRSQLYDQIYSIAHIFHCLEPRLSYGTRRRQISLEVRIVGLQFE